MAHKKKLPKSEVDEQLDQALKNTFPASDPVTVGEVTSDTPERPANRRPARIDKALVEKLANEVAARRKGAA
jgi:hypothetical protein